MTKSNESAPAAAGLAAIGSVIMASACCLPVLPFALAAGSAGASTFLISVRPYLLGCAAAFVALGFYQARRAGQCGAQPNFLSISLLWASALLVSLSIFFPQILANLVADLLS